MPDATGIIRSVIRSDANLLSAWCNHRAVAHVMPQEMHVTQMWSDKPFPVRSIDSNVVSVDLAGVRLRHLGPAAALVLAFENPGMHARWRGLMEDGARPTYPDYQPHITLSYRATNLDPADISLDDLPRRITLGPEVVIGPDVCGSHVDHTDDMLAVSKAGIEHQIVYGFASVNMSAGEMVYDSQGDAIPDSVLLDAVHEFNRGHRAGGVLHARDDSGNLVLAGEIVESLVLTSDLQKALGIDLGRTGWLIGYKVHDQDLWQSIRQGQLPAFSIGGHGVREDVT